MSQDDFDRIMCGAEDYGGDVTWRSYAEQLIRRYLVQPTPHLIQ